MSLLHVRSKVCMASFHVRSKVCMAPFHARSKVCVAPVNVLNFADFAPHMDGSNADFAPQKEGSHADFAPHKEGRHSFRDQQNAQISIFAKFLKEFVKTTWPPMFKKLIWPMRQLFILRIFWGRVPLGWNNYIKKYKKKTYYIILEQPSTMVFVEQPLALPGLLHMKMLRHVKHVTL